MHVEGKWYLICTSKSKLLLWVQFLREPQEALHRGHHCHWGWNVPQSSCAEGSAPREAPPGTSRRRATGGHWARPWGGQGPHASAPYTLALGRVASLPCKPPPGCNASTQNKQRASKTMGQTTPFRLPVPATGSWQQWPWTLCPPCLGTVSV